MSTAELFTAALALKPKLRGELIKALLDSVEGSEPAPFANASAVEIKRRQSSARPRVSHSSAIAVARASLRK
jgi:hypothetical protein